METRLREITPEPELAVLLSTYQEYGGVLDYVFLETETEEPPEKLHRAAALAGMRAIDRRLEQWAIHRASKDMPIDMFFRVRCDETKLTGKSVSFSEFWGTDDVERKPIGKNAWSIPTVDGYKTAFFHPPYNLYGGKAKEHTKLFTDINSYVFGEIPEQTQFFSWSTDWSNYFDAGHEWWGAFFWTIWLASQRRFVVIGASSTD